MRIVMLGAPGSGKGTQAALLADRTRLPAISTGEMLRGAVDAGSELGRRIETILNSGSLVDDPTMARVVRERLSEGDARTGFLLDGYPRTLDQAQALEEILDGAETQLDAVVFLAVPEEELVRRSIARQREDDTEEVIRKRQKVYRRNTEPLIAHYERRDLLRPVDGDQPIGDVAASILETLELTEVAR